MSKERIEHREVAIAADLELDLLLIHLFASSLGRLMRAAGL
jgi:hypothetical protein